MKPVLCILTILIIATSTLYGQEIEKCDVSVVLSTKNKAGQLTKKDIKDFLLTFGKECRNNVEFSEFSNEVLFLILDKQTKLTMKTIENQEGQIELDEILEDLGSPISDAIGLKSLIAKVENVKANNRLKNLIVSRLKAADGATN